MAPNPKTTVTDRENSTEISSRPMQGDEIVISGISGMFPKSDNTSEFMENLYNQVDMVQEVKCETHKTPGLPKYLGKIRNTEKFDASFFRVTPMQAASLDLQTRKIMENAYGAIFDAGINPLSLSGTKLGVVVGASNDDIVIISVFESRKNDTFALSGGSKTMQANRVSYWINAKGPSYSIDASCASGLACLELACQSIQRGDCDAAIVGGCNSCLHPILSVNLRNAGLLCLDGKTKCFDKRGDGYVRSEAVSVLFLQKVKDAKRMYAEISHIKGKFFGTPDANFIFKRKREDIEEFLKEFYSEVKISPSEVEYIEASAVGIANEDCNELDAIGRFFAKTKYVKVGSVNSNMGHTEGASGICALSKICIAYHKGELPANLHYNEAPDHIPAIRNGRLQVVTKNTPFNRGYTAVNDFSYTGMNYHALLKGNHKAKDNDRYRSYIPRIILLSGREEQGVHKALDKLQSRPIDPEEIALLHNIFKDNIPGHTGRSYIILDTNEDKETVCLARGFEFYSGTTTPVCFLYSGMGSQWCGMGTELMRIPIFTAAIERCRQVLEPLGVDIVKIITDSDETIFDNILNSMVGICAIQIGLTDVLKALEIQPDFIIGHSIGEVGCAYADGCFTAEETILSAYYRGLVSVQTPFIRGAMAAIGLGHTEILPLCPPEIQVACHNGPDSTTISGPADAVKQFVSELVGRGIFAKEVACSNIAYHSKYIAEAGPGLLSYMKKVIKKKHARSDKWISTSVPQEKWDQEIAKYASPEYFTNNLLNPVYFEENAALLPNNAVIIEIAPHGLLQAILKRSHKDCVNLTLTKRNHPDPVNVLLETIGKLYYTGSNPQVQVLYPKVEFPVSSETPMLSHLIEWEHSIDWPKISYDIKDVTESSARNVAISTHDDDFNFVNNYVMNDVKEFPESVLLHLVWETFGMYLGNNYQNTSVTFSDVTFHRKLKVEDDVLRLRILIQKGNGRFEVMNGKILITNGVIVEGANKSIHTIEPTVTDDTDITFNEEDVYTILSLKGYSFRDSFRSIVSLNTKANEAYVKWTGDWISFLDSLMQLNLFTRNHDGVSIPKIIHKLIINVPKHNIQGATIFDGITSYKAEILTSISVIRCGGVSLEGVIFEDRPRLEKQPDMLLSRKFIPYVVEEIMSLSTAITVNIQLVADELISEKINILELSSSRIISNLIEEITKTIPTHDINVNWIDLIKNNLNIKDFADNNLYFLHNLFTDQKAQELLNNLMKDETFVLSLDKNTTNIKKKYIAFKTITSIPTEKGTLVLLKKGDKRDTENITYIQVKHDDTFSWLPRVQSALQKSQRVVLVSDRQPNYGLQGIVKSLRKTNGNRISLILVDKLDVSSFNPECYIYKEQLKKTLTFNVLEKGRWGSYYNLPCSKFNVIQNVRLSSDTCNSFDDLTWVETPLTSNQNFVKVCYAGLSGKDSQKFGNDNNYSFGMDFSGYDANDMKVMALVEGGALGSTVQTESALVWPVPQHWSLEDAATVPLPYAHAYYCLAIKGQLLRNQTIFVVGGCGALGQAVISLSLSLDCTVFASVGDIRKKRFLLRSFPTLKEEHISCSYDEFFFAKMVQVTENRRCDFVVNCATGYLREAAMKCVGDNCIFLDVSNADINKNTPFGMSFMVGCRSYVSVNLSSVFRPENADQRKKLQYMVAQGIAHGIVRPLTRVVYSPLDVSRAFKLVSSSKHRGRVLIKMDDADSFKAIPRMTYLQGVHIVVCNRLNSGVELINHLIKKEAKTIILNVNENEHCVNYLRAIIALWKKNSTTIVISSDNLQTKEGCESLIRAGQKLGSVVGIFMVQDFKDEINRNILDQDYLKASFNETPLLAANLDDVSRNICKELSKFVIISICPNGTGDEYSFIECENICRTRRDMGLPALVLRSVNPKEIKHKFIQSASLPVLFNAMDLSLKLKYDNILALKYTDESKSDFDKIVERILGVRNDNDAYEIITLENQRIVDDTIKDLRSELDLTDRSLEELQKITLACLKKLYVEAKFKQNNAFSKVGLKSFYNHIERNECVITLEPFIPAKTLLPIPEDHGYLDCTKNHLLMIPGFEGHHHVFTSVAERLKIRAATLQMGPDMIFDSIPEMAETLATIYKKNFVYPSKFYILGYSFGVNVALEMASILEAEGLAGVVFCLDSSPDALRLQVDTYAEHMTDDKFQNVILEHTCRLLTDNDQMELQQELANTDKWSDKIDICLQKMYGLVSFSKDFMVSVLQSAYNRITLAREYKPELKLESEIVLIRSASKVNLDDDYNLSKYTKQPVKVFQIQSDHVSAPYDSQVSNVINKMIDPQVMEEFKTKNLCEFYYID